MVDKSAIKTYSNDTLSIDQLLQDGKRHIQQLNYILMECDRRNARGRLLGIAETYSPLSLLLMTSPNTRQRAERAVAKIVALLIDHERNHPFGGYPRQSMTDIVAAEFER